MSRGAGSAPPGQPSGLSNLQVRIVSAIALLVLVLPLTWLGGTAFRLLSVAIGAAIFYEWTRMQGAGLASAHRLTAAALLAIVLAFLLIGLPARVVLVTLVAALAGAALDARLRAQGYETVVALAYAALSAISLALLRDGDAQGLAAIALLFATVWATDILAYFVGRALGGPKLAPSISPGKTWSGAIGGAVSATAAGTAVAHYLGGASIGIAIVCLLLSIVSQVGDLFESGIKRRHGAKDSSNLIPGHGGVMDRVDGLVAGAFAMYAMGALLGGLDQPAHGLF
jgi:phosphatidate cytidylyltransferase